jgi:hypothetical protein
MPSHRCLRAAVLTLAAALLTTAPAQAAPAVANPSAKPAGTAAGAHSDFTVAFDVTGLGDTSSGDDLKSVRLDLPAGLLGNPLSTGGTCTRAQLTSDTCPAGTKVGTTTTVADVALLGTQTITGDIYNVATSGPEAARLGIVLRPALGPKVILESPASVRSSDGGLTSVVDGIPRSTSILTPGDTALRIDRMSLTLLGKLGSGQAFMTNPTSCAAAATAITIGTYGGQSATGSGSFTPTACDALPFAPQLTARVGATRADLRPGAQPEMTVTVTQQPGEANTRSVSVALPKGLGASVTALGNACPVESYDAGTCPPASVVGTATAATPLLATPLTGPVTFVSDPSLGLPRLRVALHGAFDVNLAGIVTVGPDGGLVNTFDGIYDVPLSRFVLTINAGPTSPLRVGRDLCRDEDAALTGTFVAHSGKTATSSTTAERVNCGNVEATRLRGRIGRLGPRHPALRLTAANTDRAIESLSFRLPKGLSFTHRAKKLTRVTVSGSGVTAKVSLHKGRLTVRLTGRGASRAEVSIRRHALRVAPALRRARHPHLKLRVDVRLAEGAVQRRTVGLRVVRRP